MITPTVSSRFHGNHPATRDKKPVWFAWIKREMSLGNLLMILTMFAAIGSGLFEGGMIRATLENGINAERSLREAENQGIENQLTIMSSDIRDLRNFVMDVRKGDKDGR
jgi:hypothetical protein